MTDRVYNHFYKVPRIGARRIEGLRPLSDGGGPFGFDVHAALAFDYLVERYRPDVLIETGTQLGDTLEYLGRAYPELPVLSCDIVEEHVAIAARRVRGLPNVQVTLEDSRELLKRALPRARRPLLYLDSHGEAEWPLREELTLLDEGVVCIDDFDIGQEGWAFDEYDDERCGPDLVRDVLPDAGLYVNSTESADFSLPNLQLGRRAGRGYLALDLPDEFVWSRMFRPA